MSPGLAEKAASLASEVYVSFGMTETISHIALAQLDQACGATIYQLLPGVSMDVGEEGAAVIEAPELGVTRLQTRDCITMLDASRFRWNGRLDNVINSGGLKIHPEALELIIAPAVQRLGRAFYVRSEPDERTGEKVILVLEGEALDEPDEASLLAEIRELVPGPERPRGIAYEAEFQRTASTKIVRRKTLR